jgi:hypothetical protein
MHAFKSASLWMLCLAAPAFAAHDHGHDHEHQAHVHGVAKLEVAVEGNRIDLHLESPLEALLGFEHAPRSDKERAVVARMRQTLEQGGKLFAPTAAAGCTLVSVRVEAPSLEAKPTAGGHEEHGDLDADFRFTCAQPGKLTGMEVRLSDAFPGMRRIDAQVVSGRGQSAARLTAKMRFLSW